MHVVLNWYYLCADHQLYILCRSGCEDSLDGRISSQGCADTSSDRLVTPGLIEWAVCSPTRKMAARLRLRRPGRLLIDLRVAQSTLQAVDMRLNMARKCLSGAEQQHFGKVFVENLTHQDDIVLLGRCVGPAVTQTRLQETGRATG